MIIELVVIDIAQNGSVMNLGPQGWTKEQLLYMSNTRELNRVPSTEQSTLYTNPHSPC